MKKTIKKLALAAETIAILRLGGVRGASDTTHTRTTLKSGNYCNSGVPYDCPSDLCTSGPTSNTATSYCEPA